jgi:glycosyltransferase involved in cell wall biosynthesis
MSAPSKPRSLALISNSTATALNFRRELIGALRDAGLMVYLFTPGASDAELVELESLGVEHHPFNLSRSASGIIADLHAMMGLRRDLKILAPDIVLSTFLKPVVFGSIAARLAGVPAIFSAIEGMGFAFTEGSDAAKFSRRILRSGIRLLLRKALRANRKILVLNNDDRDQLLSSRLARNEQLEFIDGIGVDLERFAPAPLPSGEPVFLYMGRMLREKGVGEFVEAARILKARHPQVQCQLLGGSDDNPGAYSEEQLRSWENEGIVRWLGNRPDVPELIAGCTVFVLPSYREGKPRSSMEAMAMGRALITTDVPGCRETVEPGVNGILVPPRDVPALSDAMERFIQTPALARSMGDESARIARERFDVNRINQRILAIMGITSFSENS